MLAQAIIAFLATIVRALAQSTERRQTIHQLFANVVSLTEHLAISLPENDNRFQKCRPCRNHYACFQN